MNSLLTVEVKQKAYELGSDLVGIGNIERWAKCPELMSPKGMMPTAKSVVVCGLRYTDAMVECSHEEGFKDHGSYASQGLMNYYLDRISYDMARKLEDMGYNAIPISASNIWRYQQYKTLDNAFCPDMSNIYSPVAAGLAEMGYHGLAMTPEFGPRNRFVSIVTDADLEATPLMEGDSLCDKCGLCSRNCPTGALVKELDGMTALEIEDKKYPFVKKNLWRCAWTEHFCLDVGLDIPDKVDEGVILDNIKKHGRSATLTGQCIKFCVPKKKRYWDKSYTKGPRRKKNISDTAKSLTTSLEDKLIQSSLSQGCDLVKVLDYNMAKDLGVNIEEYMPRAKSLVVFSLNEWATKAAKPDCKEIDLELWSYYYILHKANYNFARQLEDFGFNAAPYTFGTKAEKIKSIARQELDSEPPMVVFCVTDAELTVVTKKNQKVCYKPGKISSQEIKDYCYREGIDAVGVSSSLRIDNLSVQLGNIYNGESVLDATDTNPMFQEYKPEVKESFKRVLDCKDYLPDAKSLIVLGVRLPKATVERAGMPPSESVGPYAFAQFESHRVLRSIAVKLVRHIAIKGYKAVLSHDLMGTASVVGTPRKDDYPDVFSNRFAAMCSGLATIGKGGFPISPQYGTNMRYLAIITDADLQEDAILSSDKVNAVCADCNECLSACSVSAHREKVNITFADNEISFVKTEQNRCDWAKRYALVADGGFGNMGSKVDIMPPEKIDADNLSQALKCHDPVLKIRFCSVEKCAKRCPFNGY